MFSSKLLWNILSECYDKNREKILPPYANNLGLDLKYVLEYWLLGDGWVDKRGNYDVIGCSTSMSLILSMRDIAWSIGKYAVIQKLKRTRYGVTSKDQYWLHIRSDFRDGDRLKPISDFEYGTKAVKIEKTNFNGFVYNLQVADDESFIANGIVVHNCLMALAMPLWVLEHSFKKLEKMEKQTKAILSSWKVGGTSETNTSGGFVPSNMRNKGALPKPKFSKEVSKNIQDPKGDYLWLFSGTK
jgi:hypothetical protein